MHSVSYHVEKITEQGIVRLFSDLDLFLTEAFYFSLPGTGYRLVEYRWYVDKTTILKGK